MKIKGLVFLLVMMVPIIASETTYAVQDNGQESVESAEGVPTDEMSEEEVGDSSIWSLVSQAGGIRYPIYAILFIGLFLISWKLIELYMDNKKSNGLRNTPFTDLNLDQISKTVNRQQEHMLSVVMAKILNVFQTNKNADYLHDEISNYDRFQRDNFNSFRNRVDFLSDTAGALGLLGTVWGMFMVFSSGTLEKESILAGMGLALMSTLLGLIVSIILNFSSTITEGYFTKRLEKVTGKADELRFRLIELSEDSEPQRNTNNRNQFVAADSGEQRKEPEESFNPGAEIHLGDNEKRNKPESGQVSRSNNQPAHDSYSKEKVAEPEPEPVNNPKSISIKSGLTETAAVGEVLKKIRVELIGTEGEPVPDESLEVITKEGGKINDKNAPVTLTTNNKGVAEFDWTLDTNTGKQQAGIRCKRKEFHGVKKEFSVNAVPSEPEVLKIKNNHQAAETGKTIPKPVILTVHDKHENPVPDVELELKVSMGNGTFSDGAANTTKKTGNDGSVEFTFTLGDEPGFNAVDIEAKKYDLKQNFQAVGQEVTV